MSKAAASTVAIKSPRVLAQRGIPALVNGAESGMRRNARGRRRLIDPTTCERDYGAEEIEFMQALDRYKRTSGRMFPTCSEILEVVRSLGYVRPIDG